MKTNLSHASYAACIAFAAHSAFAAPQTTNSIANPPTNSPIAMPAIEPPKQKTWIDGFQAQIDKRVPVSAFDSFYSAQAGLRWTRFADDNGYRIASARADAGRSAMQRSLLNSARETAILCVPGVADSKTFLGEFIVGTFAHTSEQSVKTTSITPVGAQMSWWEDTLAKNKVTYGSRILEGDYLYLDSRFGHWNWGGSDRPIGVALFRIDGDPLKLQTKVEEQVSVFLPFSTALTFGSSYEITSIRNDDRKLDYSIMLSHPFGARWYEGTVSFGFSSDTKTGEKMFLMCLNKPL